jgi:signal transduction histidine kinase/DNA-binding response OmpR family regulator
MGVEEKANILVIDDRQENLLTMRLILEQLGQNVVTAESGREALRWLLDQDFAVILLDVNMPGMDGFETAALIRQRKRSVSTPIIFITAYSDEMHTAQGYSLGAVDYILSPVVPEVLRTKVSVFVELFLKNEQVKRHADERVALAREQAARAAAEEATQRSLFLAEAGMSLAKTLDFGGTLRALLNLTVPYLADLGAVTLLDGQGDFGETQLAFATGSESEVVHGLIRSRQALPAELADAIDRTLASGVPVFLSQPLFDGSALPFPSPFPLHSAVAIPLRARGRNLGAMTLAVGPSGRTFTPNDLALPEDVVSRAAIAIDNARLYRDIQESDRQKNEFLAMLAHELRNPLAPIRNAVQVLQIPHANHDQQAWAKAIIHRQVEQMVRLVDDLLDVSRITQGKIQLKIELVDAATIVNRAVETSQPLIQSRGHILNVTFPEEPLYVEADPTRLAQALGNLLNNAAKYTEKRGRIEVSVGRERDEAVFRVRDSGVGIAPEMLAHVFDLFAQVDRSLDRSQGGLGIGLTLVRRLVELHGGVVHASSAGHNQGSEFVVRLPAKEQKVPLQFSENKRVGPARPAGARRILVVDDNADSAESLAVLLRADGHEVRTALDGPAALAISEEFLPEVVVLDIGLPLMDGYEVARRLRARPGLERVDLVALTGYGQPEDRQRGKEAGFDHYLVKPARAETLLELVSSSQASDNLVTHASR